MLSRDETKMCVHRGGQVNISKSVSMVPWDYFLLCVTRHRNCSRTGRLIFLYVELGKAWTGKMDMENHGGDFLRGREGIFLSWKLCSLTALLIFTLDHCSAGLCSTPLKCDLKSVLTA